MIDHTNHYEAPKTKLRTYFPLILVLLGIIGLSISWQAIGREFSLTLSMRYFMAFFFLVFGFFKILDWRGFVDAYQGYDVVAKHSRIYGYLYPLIELTLGSLYLSGAFLLPTNIATIVVMGISSIGVIQTVRRDGHIQCACLGVLVKLPMSTITIIEDVGMGLMAIIMLAL
jgi:hypothetical protein